ncbi:hypothetical protein BN946_scf184615.g13 [Trametes cinnabarina]|uniref:Uncharacterized protein n=1 Tax=Pycnoporus cinnabarinus TaxID=5643 RepID=A0A060SPL0_PYCCI|nr:hypothetical protein BN946_scf184615.g13 [Trametes cinnabarina]
MKSFFAIFTSLAVIAATPGVSAAALGSVACANEVIADTTYIGQDKDVKVTASHCGFTPLVNAHGDEVSSLGKRQNAVNVCGAQCNTFCFAPSGGGPNEGDCAVIATALIFEAQNTGALFNITAFGTPTNKITMTYKSCTTYFLNQASTTLSYCLPDWSTLVTWLASDCNAANNAHGGLCVAADQSWYIQVQHT